MYIKEEGWYTFVTHYVHAHKSIPHAFAKNLIAFEKRQHKHTPHNAK